MTLPGPNSANKTTKNEQKHELFMKWVAVAPIWLKICACCSVFREESEYDTPGADFWARTNKN